MAYTTQADVEGEFKDLDVDATTAISDSDIDVFIEQSDAYIDSIIGLRYVTPVTGTESLKILNNISTWLVADRISKILQVKSANEEANTAEKSLRDMALEMLEKISTGLLKLSDATPISTGSGFKSYANDNALEYTFKKGENQW